MRSRCQKLISDRIHNDKCKGGKPSVVVVQILVMIPVHASFEMAFAFLCIECKGRG